MRYFRKESNILDMMLSQAACEYLPRAHVYHQDIVKGVTDVRAQRNILIYITLTSSHVRGG